MEKNKTHQVWLISSQNKYPSKKTCTQKFHFFCFVWEMTQLRWKHQCTRNRKGKEMCFLLSSKQIKLKVGKASRHWNLKPFALVVRSSPLSFYSKKNCWVPCPSAGVLYNYTGKPWRNERSRKTQSNCFQAEFYFESCCFYQRFEERSWKHLWWFWFFSKDITKYISYFPRPRLTSVHSYKRTCISVRTVIFPCKISTIFPLQK